MSTRPKRRPRPVRIPVMKELADLFGLQLWTAFEVLRDQPTRESFDAIATVLNIVGLAIEHQPKHAEAAGRINGAARALNQVAKKVEAIADGAALKMHPHELEPVRLGVAAVDETVPRLGVDQLYAARLKLRAIKREELNAAVAG